MSELNERQKALYSFLLERGDQWTCQKDIVYGLHEFYDVSFDDTKFHDSQTRKIMTADIRAINDSADVDKVILSGSRGVKIATEAEWQAAVKREYISVFKKLKRIRQKERKGLMDGQTRLAFQAEREVIEAFLQEG